jgi:ATP-dependent helicase/nuclease subunit B
MFCRSKSSIPNDFFAAFDLWMRSENEAKSSECNFTAISALINAMQKRKAVNDGRQRSNGESGDPRSEFSEWFCLCRDFLEMLLPEYVKMFSDLAEYFTRHSPMLGTMLFSEFHVFLKNNVLATCVRSPKGYTRGVIMLGLLEAQLLDSDVLIIAGLNENSMAATEENDFWLSKSMLRALHIQTAELKNEFTQCVFEKLMKKRNVLLTRSLFVSGIQQQRYRYLDKLAEKMSISNAKWLKNMEGKLTSPAVRERVVFRPPCPDVLHRPHKLSITDVSSLINNAYSLYAKKILRLKELNTMNSTANVRGNFIHKVLEEFVKKRATENPTGKAMEHLLTIAQETLQSTCREPSCFGLWYFRINNIFSFVVKNMQDCYVCVPEVRGSCTINITPDYNFELYGRADRIDINEDGTISIVDYKTGQPPSRESVKSGRNPQLAVEALMAKHDGFGLGKTIVRSTCFWGLAGSESHMKIESITEDSQETDHLAATTLRGLIDLIMKYNVLGIPYDVNADYAYDIPYLHLARVKEWNNN